MTAPASPVAPAPAALSVPVSAIPTAPVPSVPVIPLPATPVAPIPGIFFFICSLVFYSPFIAGPLPTVPSQFVVGSSSHVAIPDDAASFFVRFDQPEVNDLGPAEFWASGPPYVDLMAFESLRTVFPTE